MSDIDYNDSSLDVAVAGAEIRDADLNGSVGLSLEYRLRDRWALDFSCGFEERSGYRTSFELPRTGVFQPPPITRRVDVHTYPIELVAQYHVNTKSRLKPYVGAGARYVGSCSSFCSSRGVAFPGFEDRFSAQVVAGTHVQLTPKLSVRIDAKRLLRSHEGPFDPLLKTSVGLGWKL